MTITLRIVRKSLIGAFLLIALIADWTILAPTAPAQYSATDLASALSATSAGSAINSGVFGTSIPSIGSGNANPLTPNPSLLAVPPFGTAPPTVDFYVGLPNTPASLIYAWNFGDGAESYLPAQPYMLHVYQNPGRYMCEVELLTAQGLSQQSR